MQRLEQAVDYAAANDQVRETEARKEKEPAGPRRADASQAWIEAKAKVSMMRTAALMQDESVVAAKKELAEAQAALRAAGPAQRAQTRATPGTSAMR